MILKSADFSFLGNASISLNFSIRGKNRSVANVSAILKGYPPEHILCRQGGDTVLYAQVAGKLLTDTAYSGVPVQVGNGTTLNKLYTERLSQLATQSGIEEAVHPDHNLYSYVKSAAVAGYTAAKGGSASGAISALRTRFEDGQLLSVQYNADPVGYLTAVQNSGAGGAALLQRATASVTGTTAPSVAMKGGLSSSSNNTLSQMGLSADVFYLSSHVLYGSSRLGTKEYYPNQYRYEWNAGKTVAQNKATMDSSETSYRMPWYSYLYNSMIANDQTVPFGNGNTYPFWSTHIIGQKRYELSNHLGNVMAVVSDKLIESSAGNRAALRAAHDYYPFGMLMPMRSVEDESIHCVPISKTRYENVLVYNGPVSQGPVSVFTTGVLLPLGPPAGGGLVFDKGSDYVSLGVPNGGASVAMGVSLPLPALSGPKVGLWMRFDGFNKSSAPLTAVLQSYDATYNKWDDLAQDQFIDIGTFSFDLPAGVPQGVPLQVVVSTGESQLISLTGMSYSAYTDGLVADPQVGNGPGSAFAQGTDLRLSPEAGVQFSRGDDFARLHGSGGPPVPLGMALPLPALQSGAAGLQVSLTAGGSGPAPIQGSLQFLDPYSGNWQQVGGSSIVGGGGGPLHFDVPAGIPEALPLRLVVTTDAGIFMHLDQMNYSEYQTKLIEDREVSRGQGSAFAGAVNLDLAPMPDAATLEVGQTYANLSVPNDVAVPMGVAFSLPALGSNESGVQLQFSGESSGETSVVASLQQLVNGNSWQEVTSGVVMGSGSFFLDAPVLSAGTQLKLVVQSGSAKFVNVANMDYKTVTKAVQSYVVLSCDTDNVWNGNYRWSFNGQVRDDNLAGKGNHIAFDARGYDTRSGRFWARDPYEARFPGQSTYLFAGDNPILYIDKGGNYKIPKAKYDAYKKEYPMIVKYLATQIQADVTNSQRIVEAFQKLLPNGSDAKAYLSKATKWGSGPTLDFTPVPGDKMPGADGFYRVSDDVIQLSTFDLKPIEKVLESNASAATKSAAFQKFYQAIIHETGHRANYKDEVVGKGKENPSDGTFEHTPGIEAGFQTENRVWGQPNIKFGTYKTDDPNERKTTIFTPGIAEQTVENANKTEEGRKSLPTVPR